MFPRTLVSKPVAASIIQEGQKTANAASEGIHTPLTGFSCSQRRLIWLQNNLYFCHFFAPIKDGFSFGKQKS